MLLAGAVPFSAAEETDTSKWSHRATVSVEGLAETGLAEFVLPPDVHDVARTDFADLRVLGAAGREVAYVLRRPEGTTRKHALAVRLYNRTLLPGSRSATVDFGEKALKNRIEITVQGTDFRREVLIEGSDDGTRWQVVRSGAFLFKVERGPASSGYDKKVVAFPENDFRYLRITVKHDPGDTDVGISGVKAWRHVHTPPETVSVDVAGRQVVEKPKERATEIVLDLAWRDLPLHEMTLDFTDANFFRRVTLSGRNAMDRIVRTSMEDGSVLEKRIETPWRSLASGAVYRYSSGGNVDESLTVSLGGAGCRYIRIRIENRDDAPLIFSGAKVSRLVQYVAFQPKRGEKYALFFGNPAARMPGYDLARFARRLREEGMTATGVSDVRENPGRDREERVVPWSEKHKWLLWVAIAGIGAVLALMVWRQAKLAGSAVEEAPGKRPGGA
jgi:hypothetical protein